MVSNEINLDELEKKTSAEFVQRIKSTINNLNTREEELKEIQFSIEEDEYAITVLLCFYGN